MPPDGDIARAAPLAARIANRLARHLPTGLVRLRPKTPLVSFTFDDAPVCACTIGADLLGAYGASGTYYIAGGLIGTPARHWRVADDAHLAAVHAAGHEIGCHTYGHAFVPDLRGNAIAAEADRNKARLREAVAGLELTNFAYPYGFASLRAKRALRPIYASGRSIAPGLNRGTIDPQFLRAYPLIEPRMDAAKIARLMDQAAASNGWLVFYGHDVIAEPSPYGCSPALLESALRAAAERSIPCVSVAEALRRAL